MTNIQQIYCTHCTYGSSAIERRDGALAERVLGYSARSSSLDVTELRKSYRHVERFLYYYLPADTPPEEKLRIDASHAPRRLVYYPSINGLQMLGQISYRQQDTVGRPGSYFGHVLFSERDGGPWNVLDCLQLWGAGWADEDSPDIPFDMPALDELGQLRGGLQPIINDALLLSFLKTPPGKPFDDPHGLIPERWKITSEGERAALLTDVLQGYLSLGANRRESVLLVIEPSLAALVFYGVARLLPRGQLRDEISFSTFEPSAERLPVALAATTFHLPGTTDLRPEFYRGRGYVNNTFLKKCSERSRADGTYARVVIEKLLAAGWPDVDRVLHGFEVAKAGNARDLEELAQILELVPTMLDPAAALPQLQWSPVALNYLGRAMRERLAHEPAGSPLLTALVGTPRHLNSLTLIATDPKSPEAAEAIQFLLQRLPEEGFAELVASDRIARRFKIDALIGFVEHHCKFPEPCDPLWGGTIGKRAAEADSAAESLLAKVLTKLPGGALEELAANVPKPRSERFLLALIETCRRSPTKQSALGLLARLIGQLGDEDLCQFLIRNAAECRPNTFPKQITALRDRLNGLLNNLPTAGRQFDGQLDLLRAWVDHFPDVAEAEKRLEHWGTLRATLFTLRDVLPLKPSKGLGKPPVDYDAVGRKLAETLRRVMPDQEYQDDVTGNERVTCLRRLGAVLLGQSNFLPDDVWEKTRNYFQYGTWTKATFRSTKLPSQARRQSRKKSTSWTRTLLTLAIPAVLGLSALLLLSGYFGAGSKTEVTQVDTAKDAGQVKRSNNAPQKRAPQESSKKPAVDQEPPDQQTETKAKVPASDSRQVKPPESKDAQYKSDTPGQQPKQDGKDETNKTPSGAPAKVQLPDENKSGKNSGGTSDLSGHMPVEEANKLIETINAHEATPHQFNDAMASKNPMLRLAAIGVLTAESSCSADAVLCLLTDPDSQVRSDAYNKLKELAGCDFGHTDDSNAVEHAAARWRCWWEVRKGDRESIRKLLKTGNVNECWVAIALAKQQKLAEREKLPSVEIKSDARADKIEAEIETWIAKRDQTGRKPPENKSGASKKPPSAASATPSAAAREGTSKRFDLKYESLPDLGEKTVKIKNCDSGIRDPPFRVLEPVDVRDKFQFKPGQGGAAATHVNVYVKRHSFTTDAPDPKTNLPDNQTTQKPNKKGKDIPMSEYRLASFSVDGNAVSFNWLDWKKQDASRYAAYLRACVLQINTLNGPEYVALSKPDTREKPVEFNAGVAQITLGGVEHMRDGAHERKNIAYRLGRGKVNWKEHDYAFGEKSGEKEPYEIVGLSNQKYTLPVFIEAKHEDRTKVVTLKILGEETPNGQGRRETLGGFEGASVSAILYRVVDNGDTDEKTKVEILVEDVIIGKP